MNTLITDIAEYCDFHVGNEHFEESLEEKQRIWTEKFAEGIILECIATLSMDDGATHHEELLKERFGIKCSSTS